MNVLFLTIGQIPNLTDETVHIDVIRALRKAGHSVAVLCTREKRLGLDTELVTEDGVKILRLKIGNITRCSMIEKGINTILIERNFINAIKKYYIKDKFDLVIYNTPPITLGGVVKFCKKHFKCKSYLMLKDIFPQNAVDIGLMSTTGIKGLLYKLFRHKELVLYRNSDRIGCMSQGNVEYLLKHNPFIDKNIVEIFPNAVFNIRKQQPKNKEILTKYGIDDQKLTFIYGGNLGKPQGLDFLVEGIKSCKDIDAHFIIVGSGSEKTRIFQLLKNASNVSTLEHLPSEDYNTLCSSCDVGMVMLDKRFTIPNYPSRMLSYMENAMPIFACTDKATDVKELLEESDCGKWCYSGSLEDFVNNIKWFVDNKDKLDNMGQNGRDYMEKYFNTDICVERLENAVKEIN